MENPPFEDVFPIQDGDFPLLCLFTGGYMSFFVEWWDLMSTVKGQFHLLFRVVFFGRCHGAAVRCFSSKVFFLLGCTP